MGRTILVYGRVLLKMFWCNKDFPNILRQKTREDDK